MDSLRLKLAYQPFHFMEFNKARDGFRLPSTQRNGIGDSQDQLETLEHSVMVTIPAQIRSSASDSQDALVPRVHDEVVITLPQAIELLVVELHKFNSGSPSESGLDITAPSHDHQQTSNPRDTTLAKLPRQSPAETVDAWDQLPPGMEDMDGTRSPNRQSDGDSDDESEVLIENRSIRRKWKMPQRDEEWENARPAERASPTPTEADKNSPVSDPPWLSIIQLTDTRWPFLKTHRHGC
ncbi:hypothetical protein B0O80DRAFT_514950 [Mortierella sp. GBAus27b]|nr:hypothetical protein B0O80DRAFT_514950 [Mortierella sp. GBAus27b]